MNTETPTVFSSLAESVQHLRSDLENTQRELDQALGVWRASLLAEKKEFQSRIEAQKEAWAQQEQQWQEEKAAYEKKIQEAADAFKKQLSETEQNALRALNDLDDAWQRDKLAWHQGQARQLKELEAREAALVQEQQRQQQLIQELQDQLAALQNQPVDTEKETPAPGQFYETTVESLEYQVTVLDEMVNQLFSSAPNAAPTSSSNPTLVGHPMRRKSDLPYAFR